MRAGAKPLGRIAEEANAEGASARRLGEAPGTDEDVEHAEDDDESAGKDAYEDEIGAELLRRPSLEYTVGGAGGKHRVGRKGKESDLEVCDLAPTRKGKEVKFAVSGKVSEAEDAIFAQRPRHCTIVHSKVDEDAAKKPRAPRQGSQRSLGNSQTSGSQRAKTSRPGTRASKVGSTRSNLQRDETQRTVVSSSSSPPPKSRPQTAKLRRQQRRPPAVQTSRARTKNGRPRTVSEAPARLSSQQGERISAGERLLLKQRNGVANLRARVRANVQERLQQLDEASDQRWDVTSQLDYEMRLRQGVGTVSRDHQIGWIWETVEDERTSRRREAQSEATAEARRARRARCSTACANLYAH